MATPCRVRVATYPHEKRAACDFKKRGSPVMLPIRSNARVILTQNAHWSSLNFSERQSLAWDINFYICPRYPRRKRRKIDRVIWNIELSEHIFLFCHWLFVIFMLYSFNHIISTFGGFAKILLSKFLNSYNQTISK